jgi:D-sedoheptulose 7-phosphate isomerase
MTDKNALTGYFKEIGELLSRIEATDNRAKPLPLEKAVKKAIREILLRAKRGAKIIFVGNGGSASIASHMAIDFLKNGNIPALAFNDSSLLTCISNDLGYEYVFQRPLKILAGKNDILFSISSSGQSKNILNAAREARKKGCGVITFTGFNKNNPLRKLGDINFYVPSKSYGYVEITHLTVWHCIIEKIIHDRLSGRAIYR